MVLKESWCSLEVELGSKFRDGNSASSTTGRRPVTRLDLKAVPAWGVSDMWLEQWGQFYSSLQVWKEGVYVCEMLPYSQLCVSCPALFSSYHFSVNEISLSCLFSRMRSVRRRAPWEGTLSDFLAYLCIFSTLNKVSMCWIKKRIMNKRINSPNVSVSFLSILTSFDPPFRQYPPNNFIYYPFSFNLLKNMFHHLLWQNPISLFVYTLHTHMNLL